MAFRRPSFAVLAALAATGCLARDGRGVVPCVVHGWEATSTGPYIDKVDLLVVVDDSAGMATTQDRLAAQLPHLVATLASGDADGDGVADFPRVPDLHVGVITGDMGVGGIPNVPTCTRNAELGDDGVLLDRARVGDAACSSTYPHFLSFTPWGMARDTDLGCLARTGTAGCAFQQPLDASLKALLPSTSPVTFYAHTYGHGDDGSTNGGFLRDNSLLVVLALTSGDDCSTDYTDLWSPTSTTHTGDLAFRCVRYDDELYPASRFVDGLRSLRPANPSMVVFAAITGVPEDRVALSTPESAIDFDGLLADPRMEDVVVADGGRKHLRPACLDAVTGAPALPGRRLAEVAGAASYDGLVQSICAADYEPAIDALVARVAARLNADCEPRVLVRDAAGYTDCDVVELFQPSLDPTGPQTCADLHGVESTPVRVDADGTVACRAIEVPVAAATRATGTPPAPPASGGWYYDDFTARTRAVCPALPRTITFFRGSAPPPDVVVELQCLSSTCS